jgi:hypothetical protein
MAHPFKKDQTVRCVRAQDVGIPIAEGKLYTVKRTFRGPPPWGSGDPLPGMSKVYGVELHEHLGDAYTADRFEAAE